MLNSDPTFGGLALAPRHFLIPLLIGVCSLRLPDKIEGLRDRTRPCNAFRDFFRTRNKSYVESTDIIFDKHATSGHWLYGAYIPKDAPRVALNGKERFKLYIRQTYTTPGIYIKTGFFAVHDQVSDTPLAWGNGFSGFSKRVGSNQATNIIQNQSVRGLGRVS